MVCTAGLGVANVGSADDELGLVDELLGVELTAFALVVGLVPPAEAPPVPGDVDVQAEAPARAAVARTIVMTRWRADTCAT